MGLRGGAAFLLQLLLQRGDFYAQARFQVGDGSLALGQLPLQVINLVGQLLALLMALARRLPISSSL